MLKLTFKDSDNRVKMVNQVNEAIKTLIQSAEITRKVSTNKSTNYLNSFFKQAKHHII